jgi:hypothetical protein
MKRVLVFLVILAMGFASGCSCPRADSNGVITKSFSNCLLTAQDIVCNPSAEVLAETNVFLAIIKGVAEAFVPGTAAFMARITAENIATIGCATVTGLNGLISYMQSTQFQQAQVMQMKKGIKATAPISPQPFIDWRDTKK